MDEKYVGTCENCGGWLIHIHSESKIVCDTCNYEENVSTND